MFRVRTVKTASGSLAVQIVRYERKRTIVLKHIGSGRNDREVVLLKKEASMWIQDTSRQQSLFGRDGENENRIIQLNKCKFLGTRYSFLYETVSAVFHTIGFDTLERLLLDLVIMRIIKPSSKLHAVSLLQQFFGIELTASDIYRGMHRFATLKDSVESILVQFAKDKLNFDFNLVFYDVTTLYFESFTEDELRRCGFSKDNKGSQPQILIGLVVNRDGFPISCAVFEGNKFEGHTLLPAVLAFKKKYTIDTLTVIADAAMISKENIRELLSHGLNYIVGARLGNVSNKLIQTISQKLNQVDKKSIRLNTLNGYLICDFSLKRFHKDSQDLEKHIQKAEIFLKNPALTRKSRYLINTAKTTYALNRKLIDKTRLLLGIKGYYTNLNKPKKLIIERYHDLWKIEKSFRIAKSDLKIRPVYHFKMDTIQSHILVCFMALATLKYLEIKTGQSAAKIIEYFMSITDARLLDTVSGREINLRIEVTDEIKKLLKRIGLPY